jgi:hypothetical protein
MFSHCDRFLGSSAHPMGTRYWTQTPGAERQALFQACQTASSAQFDSTPTLQIVNVKKCHHGVVNHSRLTLNLLPGITSATRIHFYLLCHVTTPPLLAARWSADHNKVTAFTGGDLKAGWFYISIALFVWLLITFIRVKVVFRGTTCCVLRHPKLHLGTEFKRRVKWRENLSFTLCAGSLLRKWTHNLQTQEQKPE